MKRKKWTPEEKRAWREARDARLADVHGHIERIKKELEAARKPAQPEASRPPAARPRT